MCAWCGLQEKLAIQLAMLSFWFFPAGAARFISEEEYTPSASSPRQPCFRSARCNVPPRLDWRHKHDARFRPLFPPPPRRAFIGAAAGRGGRSTSDTTRICWLLSWITRACRGQLDDWWRPLSRLALGRVLLVSPWLLVESCLFLHGSNGALCPRPFANDANVWYMSSDTGRVMSSPAFARLLLWSRQFCFPSRQDKTV